jgi:hypothetical protein
VTERGLCDRNGGVFLTAETGWGDRDYLPPTSWKVWIIDEE